MAAKKSMVKKKRSTKKAPKLQPAVETLTFATPADPQYAGTFYIDIAKAASEVNRRFYRQGRQWMVAGFTFLSPVSGSISVHKLPINWVTSNSWEKTFRAWNKQQMDAVERSGTQSTVSKYRDFKVFIDVDHYNASQIPAAPPAAAAYPLLRPSDSAGTQYNEGEWEYSEIVVPHVGGAHGTKTEYKLTMLGADAADTRSIVRGYRNSRAVPEATSPEEVGPEASFLTDMFDLDNTYDELITNASDQNDDPPYDRTNYPGDVGNAPKSMVHGYANLTAQTTGIEMAQMQGGCFPCGLMEVSWNPSGSGNLFIQVHLVPGNYRGYLAPPMTEM